MRNSKTRKNNYFQAQLKINQASPQDHTNLNQKLIYNDFINPYSKQKHSLSKKSKGAKNSVLDMIPENEVSNTTIQYVSNN